MAIQAAGRGPLVRSILRAALAIFVVQAAYWLLVDPIFHRTKPPQSMVEIERIEWAKLAGPDQRSWDTAKFETKEIPFEECCEHGYRGAKVRFTLDKAPDRPLGLITRMSGDNYRISMNGSTIFSEGRIDLQDITYNGGVRRVFLVPQAVARAGINEIDVIIAHDDGTPYFNFMPPVIGDYEALSAARRSENFTLTELAIANLAMGLVLTFLLLVVVLRGGNTPILRWFLVIVAGWTGQLLYFEWISPPLHGVARMFYFYICVTALPLGWLNLANHWSGRPIAHGGRVTTGAWTVLVAFNAATLWGGLWNKLDTVDFVSMWWGLILTIGATLLLLRGVLRNFEQRHWETAVFVLCLMFIGFDSFTAVFEQVIDISTKKYADNAMPFLILGLVAAFLAQNVRLFQSSASLNALLQTQLTERTAALEAAHHREKTMVMVQAHQNERQRIMRDMHDGLGSNLMSMLLMARRGKVEAPVVADGLQTVIDEMRLMIDSMDSVGESLQSALSIFRERMQNRVEAAGKRFEWHEAEVDLPAYGPRGVLQVFRVMQEAVSNALKHSSGDTVSISIEPPASEDHALRIVVADNGSGLGAANARGRGMANMAGRAQGIGAQLAVEDGPEGVRVVLDLPPTHGDVET